MLNSISRKEFRARMRGPRAFSLLAIYLSVLGGITLLMYLAASLNFEELGGSNRAIGQPLYWVIVGMELVLVAFLAPAFTALGISTERENGTLGLLRATLLRGRHIVWSKFLAAFGYVVCLAAATLPLFGMAFLLGGVEPIQIVLASLIVLLAAFSFCAIGVFVSAHASRSIASAVVTYTLVLIITLGVPMLVFIVLGLWASSSAADPAAQQWISALSLYAASVSPIGAVTTAEANFLNQGRVWSIEMPSAVAGAAPRILPSPIFLFIALHFVLGLLLLWLAIRRVDRLDSR